MGSPKSRQALERLGQDIRKARLLRGSTVADLAVRAGTSPSSIARLEKGDRGVAIGMLADVLVVLGLIDRLSNLIDIRKDELGLALALDRLPKRGRRVVTNSRGQKTVMEQGQYDGKTIDPEGVAF